MRRAKGEGRFISHWRMRGLSHTSMMLKPWAPDWSACSMAVSLASSV
jgi:hypothetical protein